MIKGYKKASVFLSIVMLLALLVSACSSSSNSNNSDQGEPSKGASSPAATETATPEATQESLEPVTLKWLVPKTATMDKADEVFAAVNKLTQEKINATIDFMLVDFGEYDQKVSMMLAANENFDIAFTSNWLNPYIPNVAKGAYLALDDDMLKKYAPQTMATTSAAVWDAIKVDGKIYGTPIQQIYVRQFGLMFKEELLDKYKFDYTSVAKLEDLEPYLKQIKENEPDLFPLEAVGSSIWESALGYYGFDSLIGVKTPGAVKSFGELKAVNQYESQEFKDYVTLMHDWYQKGYIQKDAATSTTDYRSQGKYAVATVPALQPGGDAQFSSTQAGGTPYVGYGIGEQPPLTTGSIQATLNAINKNSKNPERALMFIDLLNSDPEILNMMAFGLEGLSYTKNADGKVVQKMDGAYDGVYNFFVGNVFNTYYTEGQPDGVWEEMAKINEEAKPSVALGFVFNSEPVTNELAKVQAVIDQYLKALASGSVDVDKVLPEFIQKLKNAGSDAIVAELQKQLDAWAAKK